MMKSNESFGADYEAAGRIVRMNEAFEIPREFLSIYQRNTLGIFAF